MTLDQGANWREQGQAAARAGDRDTARHALEQALRANPSDAEAWFWMAAVQTDPHRALSALERVLALDPHHSRARTGIAAIRAQLGQAAPPVVEPPSAAHAAAAAAPRPVAVPDVPPPPGLPPVTAGPAPSPFVVSRVPLAAGVPTTPFNRGIIPFGPAPLTFSTFGPATRVLPASAGGDGHGHAALDELTRQGIVAAREGRLDEARTLLLTVVDQDESNEAAWFCLSTILDDREDIQVALENTLHLNPQNAAARQALDRLLGAGDAPDASLLDDLALEEEEPEIHFPSTYIQPAVSDWDSVTVAETPHDDPSSDPDYEYSHMIGQIMGGRYRVVALFPSQGSTLLLASDIKNGTYLLIKPEVESFSKSSQAGIKRGFQHHGKSFVVSNISLNGLNLRTFMGSIGIMPPAQVVDYGLRLIREIRRAEQPLVMRRSWGPEKIIINHDGVLDLSAPAPVGEPPGPGSFSPPEHRAGNTLDGRSDVYLVGALMYYLATGNLAPAQIPQPKPDPAVAALPAPPRGPAPVVRPVATFPGASGLNPYLAGVMATALQPDPADRFPSLEALRLALDMLYGEFRDVARREARASQGTPGWVLYAGGTAAAIILFLLFGMWATNRSNPNIGGEGTPITIRIVATAGPGGPGRTVAVARNVQLQERGQPIAFDPRGITSTSRIQIQQVDTNKAPAIVMYVNVVSAGRQPVGDLSRQNFTVTDDGGDVADFEVVNLSQTTDSLSALLVIDTSGSMSGTALLEAKNAAKQFVEISTLEDRMGLITFNDVITIPQELTSTKALVIEKIAAMEAYGNTAVYDALYTALEQAAKEKGRTMIILLSDGRDTASTLHTRDEVVQLSKLYGIPIHVIGLSGSEDYDAEMTADITLHTGGVLLESPDPFALTDLYKTLAFQIAGQYKVTFQGSDIPGPHTVRITTESLGKTYQDTVEYTVK